ncbi:unnamed protein product [Cylicocyclus nassatus]|uniref:RUN and FYVE domain-containing protein 2 n=1 Tax=Cylicocyclus nassatus TaxID=53992 RepID=A0AA36H5C4_CYLNA|nr:unnamed protein product [Cylicocyclus nassatus]
MFSSSGFSLVSAFSDDGQRLTRSQKIHRENERTNLLTITRLVLRAFLENTMADNNRILECDTQQISDLLMMLEKVLWHGFKAPGQKALIVLRSPDAEMWAAINRIARADPAMLETVTCVDQIESLLTPISRLRAFLRLAMMQKKLFDFFNVIANSSQLSTFYESWALLRQEEIVQLTGALLGLSVVDCNLVLEHDHLQDQPLSVDLSLYIRIPTVPTEGADDVTANGTSTSNKDKKLLLDQNNYLEERNRQLQCNVENLKKRINVLESDKEAAAVTVEKELVSFKNIENAANEHAQSSKEKEWEEERERLLGQIVEREDSLRIVQQQLVDVKKINTDLYDKLKLSDERCRRLERDVGRVREQYVQDTESLKKTISNLEVSNAVLQENAQKRHENEETVRAELEKKYGQNAELVGTLQEKQNALAEAESEIVVLRQKVNSQEKELKEMPFLKEELRELQEKYDSVSERADQSERALEELGGHLGESKLRMLELAEELLPLSDAQWAKDSDVTQCTACSDKFTLSKRKHHCRMCGSIFCDACSVARIKLPSNSKPARLWISVIGDLFIRDGTAESLAFGDDDHMTVGVYIVCSPTNVLQHRNDEVSLNNIAKRLNLARSLVQAIVEDELGPQSYRMLIGHEDQRSKSDSSGIIKVRPFLEKMSSTNDILARLGTGASSDFDIKASSADPDEYLPKDVRPSNGLDLNPLDCGVC